MQFLHFPLLHALVCSQFLAWFPGFTLASTTFRIHFRGFLHVPTAGTAEVSVPFIYCYFYFVEWQAHGSFTMAVLQVSELNSGNLPCCSTVVPGNWDESRDFSEQGPRPPRLQGPPRPRWRHEGTIQAWRRPCFATGGPVEVHVYASRSCRKWNSRVLGVSREEVDFMDREPSW